MSNHITTQMQASGHTVIGNTALFDSKPSVQLATKWEEEYQRILDAKYKRGRRNYSTTLLRKEPVVAYENPPIFVVPRQRGGPSYKSIPLVHNGERIDDASKPGVVAYLPISKGYPMGDLSSFTLGPVVNGGLCVVNSAFSKIVCPFHLVGGKVDLKAKGYWKKDKTPVHTVEVIDEYTRTSVGRMRVDGVVHDTLEWLTKHESEWKPEWEKWRRCVAMSSMGSFHWDRSEVPIIFWDGKKYCDFVEWKKQCYILPAYELLEREAAYQYIVQLRQNGYAVALVHPKGLNGIEVPITSEYIRRLYDGVDMCCLPYVVVGKLLGVPINA